MRKSIILIFLAVFELSWAQETVLVTRDRDLEYYEEFAVLSNDKKIKHGHYLKLWKVLHLGSGMEYAIESAGTFAKGQKHGYWESYYGKTNNIKEKGFYRAGLRDSTWEFYYPEGVARKLVEVQSSEGTSMQIEGAEPKILMTGDFKNGMKVGIWQYFDGNAVVQKFDHDTNTLTFFSNGDPKNIDAGFIGGDFVMEQYLYETFNLDQLLESINSKIGMKSWKIVLKFSVDESGKVDEISEESNTSFNKKITLRALETTKNLSGMFYPKMVNGIPEPVTRKITFDMGVATDFRTTSSERWVSSSTIKNFKLNIDVTK